MLVFGACRNPHCKFGRRVQARRCTVYKKPGPRYTICFLVRKFSSISWWQEGAVKRDRHATTSGVRLPNYVLKIGAADLRGTLFYRCTYASHEQYGRAVSLHSFCLDLSYKLHITGVSAWSTSIEYIHHENKKRIDITYTEIFCTCMQANNQLRSYHSNSHPHALIYTHDLLHEQYSHCSTEWPTAC